jgi:hypothetical protein
VRKLPEAPLSIFVCSKVDFEILDRKSCFDELILLDTTILIVNIAGFNICNEVAKVEIYFEEFLLFVVYCNTY